MGRNEETDIFRLMEPVELSISDKPEEKPLQVTEEVKQEVQPTYRSSLPTDRLHPAVLVWRLQEKLAESTDEKLCDLLTDTIAFINTSVIPQPRIEPIPQAPIKPPVAKPTKQPENKGSNHRILGISIVAATATLIVGLILLTL